MELKNTWVQNENKDMVKFALPGLKRRTARTFLTVLGVIIGTVCIASDAYSKKQSGTSTNINILARPDDTDRSVQLDQKQCLRARANAGATLAALQVLQPLLFNLEKPRPRP